MQITTISAPNQVMASTPTGKTTNWRRPREHTPRWETISSNSIRRTSRKPATAQEKHWKYGYHIGNNSSCGLKHVSVPDGSDGCGKTSYPLSENQTIPVAQATGHVSYLPCGGYHPLALILATRRVLYYARRSGDRLQLLSVRNVVTYTHHQNDTYDTPFAGVAVMQ
jgi:hypothetical protein